MYENVKFVQQENFWIGPGSVSTLPLMMFHRSKIIQAITMWNYLEINTTFFDFPFIYRWLGVSDPLGGQILSMHAAGQAGA